MKKNIFRKIIAVTALGIAAIGTLGIFAEEAPLMTVYASDTVATGTSGDCTWTLDSDGLLYIGLTDSAQTSGYLGTWDDSGWYSAPWLKNQTTREAIKTVKFGPGVKAKTCYCMFTGAKNMTSIDLENLDTSEVETMENMFDNCDSLTSLDVSGLDTSSVTNMSSMFKDMDSLTSLNVSGLDTSSVTNMQAMFSADYSLTTLDLSTFDTSNVTDISFMFCNSVSLTTLDLSSWDVSNVKDMQLMFAVFWSAYSAMGLTSINLSGWDTKNVENMKGMFSRCPYLTSLDLSSFNTEKVTAMTGMFEYDSGLTALDLSSFKTPVVTDVDYMFDGCSALTTLDISGLDISSVTSEYKDCMFSGATSLSSLSLPAGEDFTGTDLLESPWYDKDAIAFGDTASMLADNAGRTSGSMTYTVKKDVRYASVTLSEDSFVYTGSAITPDTTVTLYGTTLAKDTDYEVSVDKYTAGTSTVTIKGIGTYQGTIGKTFTITPASMSVTATNGTATYTGSETTGGAALSVSGPSSYTVKYGITEGTYTLDEIPSYTDAGTYTVYYKVTADNYKDVTGSFTIVISQGAAAITVDTTTITKSYGETVVLPEATTTFGTVTCDKTSSDLVNVGTYKVTYTVAGTDNYNGATAALEVEITKATAAITVDTTAITKTYGEAVTLPEATTTFGTVTCDKTSSDLVNVGTYKVTYTVAGTDNYNGATAALEVEITKADAVITVNTKTITKTYGDTVTLPVASSSFGTVNCDTEASDLVKPGTYTVTYTVEGTDNYNGATKTLTVIINKKEVTVTRVKNAFTYDGTNQISKLTATYVNVSGETVAMKVHTCILWSQSAEDTGIIEDFENSQMYAVWYTFVTEEEAECYTFTSTGKSYTITKGAAVITVDDTPITKVYDGTEASIPEATTNFGSLTVTKSAKSFIDVGSYTVTYTVAGTDNYTGDTKTLTITICKESYDMSGISFTDATYTYDGGEKTLSITGTLPDGVTVAYTANQLTNAGTLQVTATFTGDDNHEDIPSLTATLTVLKEKAEITVNTEDITVTYGEAVVLPEASTNFGSVTCDTVSSDLVNSGTYTVIYMVKGTDNYEGDTKSLTVTINKASQDVIVNEEVVTYKKWASNIAYVVSGENTENAKVEYYLNDAWTTVVPSSAGTYDVRVTIPGDENHLDSVKEIEGGLVICGFFESVLSLFTPVADFFKSLTYVQIAGIAGGAVVVIGLVIVLPVSIAKHKKKKNGKK